MEEGSREVGTVCRDASRGRWATRPHARQNEEARQTHRAGYTGTLMHQSYFLFALAS